MLVARIAKFGLNSYQDELTIAEVEKIDSWLKSWNCENNFQCVLAETKEEAIESCRQDASKLVKMLGFKLKVFSFEIAIDEVKNGRFFYPHIIYCHKFGLVEAEKEHA